jgi:hypothetical protein
MTKPFDIAVEALATPVSVGVPLPSATGSEFSGNVSFALLPSGNSQEKNPEPAAKSFYIETFGCQMNVHDSEKVSGVLLARGYRPADSASAASLVLYNTCSIREKAAQKVFSRLGEWRGAARDQGKIIGVLGCVAQQEGEEIFED